MEPFSIAAEGKGLSGMLNRVRVIGGRYGLTHVKMDQTLSYFARILSHFNCGATFPITAVTLARSNGFHEKYQGRNIEFAVHGYYHVDHKRLTLSQQLTHMELAIRLFKERGLTSEGFRSPYLRWSEDTINAEMQSGFLYDSSQGIAWDVVGEFPIESYRRVLEFYGAVSADAYPGLPRLEKEFVRIPYCLPDDEALIDRLRLGQTNRINEPWLSILTETYRRGELFTLGLHPERITQCASPLIETLRQASKLYPGVWIARLNELARWWKARMEAMVRIDQDQEGEFHIKVDAPAGVTILMRGVEVLSAAGPWDGVYLKALENNANFRAARRPFIGISLSSSGSLEDFLRQQGYIVERVEEGQNHSIYLDSSQFQREDERSLLEQIEQGDFPLVRLGRWPNGARSALCITGDIDALTIWDYGLRLLGT